MTRLQWLALGLVVVTACGGAAGKFDGHGGPVPDWTLEPDRCAQTQAGAWLVSAVADLYYAGVHANDTEVVVRDSGAERQVLVRIPGKDKMVVLRRADCAVFDIATSGTGYVVNDEQGVTGHVRLDCTRPEIGHVTGSATFTCF